jgi:SAM-dependent methyltransferase
VDRITENAKQLYDEIRFGHLSYERAKYNPLLFEFLDRVKEGHSLFDIGCGSGYWMEVYAKYGIKKDQMTGVDLSPISIKSLIQRGFHGICGNVLHLELDDCISDATISIGVIHHTTDPFQAFKELVRITKPGGYLYLSVYNCWNPYYYIVHRGTFPIRYLYWHWNKRIAGRIYPFSKLFYQPLAFLLLGRRLDEKSGKTLFMDQVFTPKAHLFSKKKIKSYTKRCDCDIIRIEYTNAFFMVTSILRKSSCNRIKGNLYRST